MANYDQRLPLDGRFGQLSGGVDALATSLTSADFAGLPSDLSTVKYVPIVLADDSQRLFEVVWVTGHSAGSTTVTVIRGREGSTARSWGAGALWRCGPTSRDAQPLYANRAALPADAHLGMRAFLLDEGRPVVKGANGWAIASADVPFGHAGRAAGFQTGLSGGGYVGLASQELAGGMTFEAANNALVVPLAGRYLVVLKSYFSGTTGLCEARVTINDTANPPGAYAVNTTFDKTSTQDDARGVTATYMLTAGAKLRFWAKTPASVWGTSGYDGAFIEARYLGPS